MKKRVAIAGFLHETNTFAPSPATYDNFLEGGGHMPLSCGDDLLERCPRVNIGISGAVEFGKHANWELVPLLWAAAIPSAHVEKIAFEKILCDLILRLEAAGDLDGVYLDLHGAMVCQHVDDGEGEIIARVRAAVGPDVPVAVTLDLHGNVTQKMVTESDVMVAYRTYPHVDMAESGRRTAVQLNALMMRGAPFAKAFRQLPFLIPIPWQCTDIEPAKNLYSSLGKAEGSMVSSLSFLTGFPAADFADCAPCVLGYGEDAVAVQAAVDDFCAEVLDRETDFGGKAYSPDEGVALAISLSEQTTKPIVIADTQDNPGAGGDSNTAGLLKALVDADAQRAALGLMVDPDAARLVHEAGEGVEILLTLGGKSGVVGDVSFSGTFRIEKLSGGKFTTTGPYYGGAQMDLGPSACLVLGGVRVVLASKKVQMADQAMYRFVGIEPMDQAILVNKSSVHFRADFAPIAADILVCTAPGPMALYASDLPFKKLSKGIRLSPGGPAFNSNEQEAVAKAS